MPIYEYRCQQCGHELEKLQRMSDPLLVDCPACEKPALKKLISAAAFRLKGTGWYETDFKKEGKRNLAGEKDSASSSSTTDSKQTDKKDTTATDKSAGGSSKKDSQTNTKSSTKAAEKKAAPTAST